MGGVRTKHHFGLSCLICLIEWLVVAPPTIAPRLRPPSAASSSPAHHRPAPSSRSLTTGLFPS